MKLNIKRYAALLSCAALCVGAGCSSSFLDEEDSSTIAPETFFTDPEDAESAVRGTYENFRFHCDGAGIFSANFQLLDLYL